MEKLKLHKKPLLKMFFIQYGEALGLEIGLIICYNFVDLNFFIFQLLLIPIVFLLIISKYNKSVTTIEIDSKNKLISLEQNHFLILTKSFKIPFDKIFFQLRWKWRLNIYGQVLEIKEGEKLIAVIPMKGSIWNLNELNSLINSLVELNEEGEIEANLVV